MCSEFIHCTDCAYLLESKRGSKFKYQCLNSGFYLQENNMFGCSDGRPKEKKRKLSKLADHPELKVCSCCKKAKPLSEFYTRKGGKLYSLCKACHKAKVDASKAKRKASAAMSEILSHQSIKPDYKNSQEGPISFTFEIKTFNLEEVKVQLIKRCIEEYPFETVEQIADRLGISSHSLFKYANKYNLVFGFNPTSEGLIQDAISKLSALGYNITKK